MSSVIDERVVQMSFDNDQFEKGVSQTIKSLNKLDKTLVDTADGEYFTNMEERISKVEQAFSKSGMVINGILLTIGQTITQYINKGLAALTQGIRGGMAEYETQMGATQTILANVKDEGKGIDDVTAALDELNTYADKTIYNFTEMTRNIGMFTAAGANLDTSVATIKGLANAAALVGANATTAARAWYQVSQAMAAGSFKLMDWRSLEISNIAGEGFKSVLTEVARKDGLAVAKMIDNGTALRDTLKSGWLTAERFAEAMSILTNELSEDQLKTLGYTEEQAKKLKEIATEAEYAAIKVKSFSQLIETTNEAIGSGWAVTFRTIIGDFERAKEFYTRISITLNSIIDKISDYRNHFIDLVWNWSPSGGVSPYENFKRTLDNILAIFSTFIGAVRAGFDNIFKWTDINKGLNEFAEKVKKTTGALVLNEYKDITNRRKNREEELKDIEHEYEELNDFEKANIWDLDYVTEGIKDLIRIFRGAFAAVDMVLRTIGDTFNWLIQQIPGIDNFYENLENGNLGVLSTLANIMDNVTKLRNIIVKMNLIPRVLNLIKQEIIKIIKTNPLIQGMLKGVAYALALVKTLIQTILTLNINPLNVLIGVVKLIGGAFIGLVSLIGQAISKVVEFFTGVTDLSFLENIGKDIYTFIKILDELGKGTISVADIFDYYKAKVINAFKEIMHSPFVEGFMKFFIVAYSTIKNFWDNVIYNFNNAKNVITNFFEELNINWKSVGIFGALAAVGILLYKWLTDIEGIVGLAKRVGQVLQAYANKENSEAILNVAYAVGILAASLFLLSFVPYQQLLDATSMLIATVTIFIMLFAVLEKTFDALEKVKTAMKPVEKIFINFSVGLKKFLARSGTAILLEAVGDALIKITIAVVGLAAAFEFMPNSMDKAIKVLAGVGTALVILVGVLAYFTNKTNSLKGFKGFIDAGKLLNLGITNFLDSLSQSIRLVAISVMIEAFADAVVKLAAAFAIISYVVDDKDKWIKSLGSLYVIVAMMASVVFLMSQFATSVAFGTLIGFSLLMTVFGTCVAGLSAIAVMLGQVDWDVLFKGVSSVVAIVGILGVMMSVMVHAISVGFAPIAALALILVALGAAFSAIILASSQIQNDTQITALVSSLAGMYLVIGAIAGLSALLGTISSLNPTIILSLAGVIGSIAVLFTALGYTLSVIDNVYINTETLVALGMLLAAVVLLTGIVGALSLAIGTVTEANALIGAVALAAIYGLAASITAYALVANAIGQLILNISLAALNLEEAIENFYGMLEYVAKFADQIIWTLIGAAVGIAAMIPELFPLFVSIGVALGTAVNGFLLGLQMVIQGIVLNVCTMLLTIISQIADWVNNNADLIQSAMIKVLRALLNIAIIALNVVIHEALPRLLGLLIQIATEIMSTWNTILLTLLKDLFLTLGELIEPYNKEVGTFFTNLGKAFGILAAIIKKVAEEIIEYIGWVIDGITEINNTVNLITGTTDESLEVTHEGVKNFAQTIKDLQETCKNGGKVIVDTNEEVADSTGKTGEVTVKAVKNTIGVKEEEAAACYETAEAYKDSTEEEVQTQIDASKVIQDVVDGNWDSIVNMFASGFSTNLDNQMAYINSMINNEEYLGQELNNTTAVTLEKNKNLYAEFYGAHSKAAVQFHDALTDYTNALDGGHADVTTMKKALADYQYAIKDPLKELKDAGFTMQDILLGDDGLKIVKNTSKSIASATFDSWESISKEFNDLWNNYTVEDVDTSMYSPSFGTSGTDTSKLESELKDRNDTIGKYDSEIQPKDLTPTIDLDSLKNEVNQANGIMTGSLLAAQNAAIGDYINTDSELNPFLKDRWQNTYNFTQNNYSPKALSRIDIYRQTQNQLRLSRGF